MNIIKKLPEDIRRAIIPYTYNIQPKFLLKDIRHYHISFRILNDLNRPRLTIFGEHLESPALLLNNIWVWILAHFKNYYTVCKRFLKISTEKRAKIWIGKKYITKPIKTQIRIIWALLTVTERTKFLTTTNDTESGKFLLTNGFI